MRLSFAVFAVALARELVRHKLALLMTEFLDAKMREIDAMLGPPSSPATMAIQAFPLIDFPIGRGEEEIGWASDDLALPKLPICKP